MVGTRRPPLLGLPVLLVLGGLLCLCLAAPGPRGGGPRLWRPSAAEGLRAAGVLGWLGQRGPPRGRSLAPRRHGVAQEGGSPRTPPSDAVPVQDRPAPPGPPSWGPTPRPRRASLALYLTLMAWAGLALQRLGTPPAAVAAPAPPFRAVGGLFQQEQGTAIPRTIYPNFGALLPWPVIHQAITPRRKLIFFIRHAQGYHNQAHREMEKMGLDPDEASVACVWEGVGDPLDLFDPFLTPLGVNQALGLNAQLRGPAGLRAVVPGRAPLQVISSPMVRCLQTAKFAFDGLLEAPIKASELCREAITLATSESRHSVSDPDPGAQTHPCPYKQGLRTLCGDIAQFPVLKDPLRLPVTEADYRRLLARGLPLGLLADADPVWLFAATPDDVTESPEQLRMRIDLFLASLFDNVRDPALAVVTHSTFIAALTETVGQRRYFPQNCEVVPVLVQDCRAAPA